MTKSVGCLVLFFFNWCVNFAEWRAAFPVLPLQGMVSAEAERLFGLAGVEEGFNWLCRSDNLSPPVLFLSWQAR